MHTQVIDYDLPKVSVLLMMTASELLYNQIDRLLMTDREGELIVSKSLLFFLI